MRTTIDIPDDLLRRAKAEAALRGLRLKDLVRDALQRFLLDAGRLPEPEGGEEPGEQELAAGCVFPLITGTTGPAMSDLRGEGAQRLLDDEDIEREARSR